MSDVRFVDCRHSLTNPDLGYQLYSEEHLPGAVFAHLDKNLSGMMTGTNGRHPLPDLQDFHNWLQENQLTPGSTIVCYDNLEGGIAARLWWMLTQLGYEDVYILSSSISQWKEIEGSVSSDLPGVERETFDLPIQNWSEGPYQIKTLEEMFDETPSSYFIDSRAPERYQGKEEPYDKVAGRIPGATNLFWQSHLTDGKVDRSSLDQSSLNLTKLDQHTVYCGSGVTAAFNLAVFEHYDLPKPAFYPGSYSEWSQNYPDNTEKDE